MFDKSQLPDITEREQAFELHRVYEAAGDAMYELVEIDADREAMRLAKAKSNEAEAAYEACGIALEIDANCRAVRCVVSDAPIVEGDETLHDYVTGEHVLRIAIGLPPREEAKQLLPDMIQGEAAE